MQAQRECVSAVLSQILKCLSTELRHLFVCRLTSKHLRVRKQWLWRSDGPLVQRHIQQNTSLQAEAHAALAGGAGAHAALHAGRAGNAAPAEAAEGETGGLAAALAVLLTLQLAHCSL